MIVKLILLFVTKVVYQEPARYYNGPGLSALVVYLSVSTPIQQTVRISSTGVSWTGGSLGCPIIHLNHVTKLCSCPTELHGSKINEKNFSAELNFLILPKFFLIGFGPMELSWANAELCYMI